MAEQSSEQVHQTKAELADKSIDNGPIKIMPIREDMRKMAPRIKENFYIFLRAYDELKNTHPDEFKRVLEKHPKLAPEIKKIDSVMSMILGEKEVSDSEITKMIDTYNSAARAINTMMLSQKISDEEDPKNMFMQAARGELPFDEKSLTPEDKQELKKIAADLYSELFPDSLTDKLVKYANSSFADMAHIPPMMRGNLPLWMTAKENVKGWQKIGAAPMNGIESAVKGVGNLVLHPLNTLKETGKGLLAMVKLGFSPEERAAAYHAIKFICSQLSTEERVSAIISVTYSMVLLTGGTVNIINRLKKIGASTKIIGLITAMDLTVASSRLKEGTKIVPLATMTGIALPYIKS